MQSSKSYLSFLIIWLTRYRPQNHFFWRHIPNKVIITSLSHLDTFYPCCQNGGKWWIFIGQRQSSKQNGKVRILLNVFLAIHFRFYQEPITPVFMHSPHLQWNTKNLGTVMENLPSTSLTYQIFRYSIICTSLTTWIPRLALHSPLQTMLGWRNTFRTG